MRIEVCDLWLYRAIWDTWNRLPADARCVLDPVVFVEDRALNGRWADAGDWDIRVKPFPILTSQCAAIGVLAHELGHLAGDHYRRCAAGVLSREAAEQEADCYVRLWGFERELAARRRLLGR